MKILDWKDDRTMRIATIIYDEFGDHKGLGTI